MGPNYSHIMRLSADTIARYRREAADARAVKRARARDANGTPSRADARPGHPHPLEPAPTPS